MHVNAGISMFTTLFCSKWLFDEYATQQSRNSSTPVHFIFLKEQTTDTKIWYEYTAWRLTNWCVFELTKWKVLCESCG